MESNYTTVLDAGTPTLPVLPLLLMLAAPILMLACIHVAQARKWRISQPIKWALWGAYAFYAPIVISQYWSLWGGQISARNATAMSVEAGTLDWAAVRQEPAGLFIETKQRFAVNGVDFEYRHQSLRYLDFLLPQPDLVTLPLADHAQVRVTYRDEGAERELLRFEIATRDQDAHD